MRRVAGGFAVLKRGQPDAVQGDVGVSRIRIERLADDQTGFAMRISVRSRNLMSAARVRSPDIFTQTK